MDKAELQNTTDVSAANAHAAETMAAYGRGPSGQFDPASVGPAPLTDINGFLNHHPVLFMMGLALLPGGGEDEELVDIGERRIMQNEPNPIDDPFLKRCPQCGHIFMEEQPTFRDGGQGFGRWGEWSSVRIPGGTLDQFGDTGVWGGRSLYQENYMGGFRTTDHTFRLPEGLSYERAISEFGGVSYENGAFWIFTKKPVTTFYPF